MTKEELITKYPFIQQRDIHGNPIDNYTFLDDLPIGWSKRFGERICADIKAALTKANCLEDYEIYQVKEKYLQIRWYDNHPEITEGIIDRYSEQAINACVECGRYTTFEVNNVPRCIDCAKKNHLI